MKKLLIMALLTMLVMLSGCSAAPQEQNTTPVSKTSNDGWELIGNKEGCKLYRKFIMGDGHIYWTVCKNSGYGANTAVTK